MDVFEGCNEEIKNEENKNEDKNEEETEKKDEEPLWLKEFKK